MTDGRRALAQRNDLLWLYSRPLILTIHSAGAAIALWAPSQLEPGSMADRLVRGIGAVVPMVNNFAARSSMPDVLRLYAAVMLATVPFWIHAWLRWPGREARIRSQLQKARQSLAILLGMHFFPVLVLAIVYVSLFEARPGDFATIPFQSSRLALALGGPIIFCLLPAAVVPGLLMPFETLRRYWKEA